MLMNKAKAAVLPKVLIAFLLVKAAASRRA
jgi:hypothetical protein